MQQLMEGVAGCDSARRRSARSRASSSAGANSSLTASPPCRHRRLPSRPLRYGSFGGIRRAGGVGIVDVDEDLAADAKLGEGRQASRRVPETLICPMRCPVLVPTPWAIISSSRHSVPSKNTSAAPSSRSASAGGHPRRRPARRRNSRSPAAMSSPTVSPGACRDPAPHSVLEVERDLARHGERLDAQAKRRRRPARERSTGRSSGSSAGRQNPDSATLKIGLARSTPSTRFVAYSASGWLSRSVKQAGDVVDVAVGQHRAGDRADGAVRRGCSAASPGSAGADPARHSTTPSARRRR